MLSHFESRAQRVAFLSLGAALAALIAMTIASAATQIGRTAPGFVVWRNLVAPAIGAPDWPGVRAGIPQREVVIAADGVAVRDAGELRARIRALPPGTPIRYEFRRTGPVTAVVVPSATLRWRDVLPVYLPYWVDGVAFFAVGLVVFYFRPSLAAARAGLVLGALFGTVLILASDVFSAFWLDRLYFVCESLLPAALLHFTLCFPEEKEVLRRRPGLVFALYAVFAPIGVAQAVLATGDPGLHLRVNDWVYTAIAGAGLVSVASLVHAFVTSRSPLARQQAKVVLAGAALAAFVPSLGILAIVLLRADVPMNLLAPFFLVYPLSIGYAIARHDLFGVDRYLRLGVVWGALTLLIFLSWVGVVVVLEAWLGAERGLPVAVVPAYLLVVLLLFDPLRSAIQRMVDRLFHRQAYSFRASVEATSRVLASVLDSERIAATVLATLTDVMAIEWAVLVALGEEDGAPRCFGAPPARAAEVGALVPAGDPLPARIAAAGRPIHRYGEAPGESRGAADAHARRLLEALDAILIWPLRFEAEPVGLLVLGGKKSGAYYSDDDLQMLETLGNQCALALTNARAYEIIARTQAELVEAERLAAVGELAATVAHGIRNPLAGIRAAAQLAREDAEPGSAVGESLDDIIAEADRLERRVRSILDLSRPFGLEAVPADLNEFLRAFTAGLRGRAPGSVRVDLALGATVPPVAFDPPKLAEALDIVVTNAIDAMGGAGTIRIGSRLEGEGAAARAAIEVADSGPGIDAARIGRVFELFYTTKPTGTGVGLAMAKRLVERQGGSIEVSSHPGAGATFTLRLPLARPGREVGEAGS